MEMFKGTILYEYIFHLSQAQWTGKGKFCFVFDGPSQESYTTSTWMWRNAASIGEQNKSFVSLG